MAFGHTPRDSQRQRLYDAGYVEGRRLETIREVEAYVKKIEASKWFQKRFPWLRATVYRIKVHAGQGHRSASGGWKGGHLVVTIPKSQRDEGTVLHEIAHCIVNQKSYAAHGPEFARVFLELVRHFQGSEPYNTMRLSYKAGKVKVATPDWHPRQKETKKPPVKTRVAANAAHPVTAQRTKLVAPTSRAALRPDAIAKPREVARPIVIGNLADVMASAKDLDAASDAYLLGYEKGKAVRLTPERLSRYTELEFGKIALIQLVKGIEFLIEHPTFDTEGNRVLDIEAALSLELAAAKGALERIDRNG